MDFTAEQVNTLAARPAVVSDGCDDESDCPPVSSHRFVDDEQSHFRARLLSLVAGGGCQRPRDDSLRDGHDVQRHLLVARALRDGRSEHRWKRSMARRHARFIPQATRRSRGASTSTRVRRRSTLSPMTRGGVQGWLVVCPSLEHAALPIHVATRSAVSPTSRRCGIPKKAQLFLIELVLLDPATSLCSDEVANQSALQPLRRVGSQDRLIRNPRLVMSDKRVNPSQRSIKRRLLSQVHGR